MLISKAWTQKPHTGVRHVAWVRRYLFLNYMTRLTCSPAVSLSTMCCTLACCSAFLAWAWKIKKVKYGPQDWTWNISIGIFFNCMRELISDTKLRIERLNNIQASTHITFMVPVISEIKRGWIGDQRFGNQNARDRNSRLFFLFFFLLFCFVFFFNSFRKAIQRAFWIMSGNQIDWKQKS